MIVPASYGTGSRLDVFEFARNQSQLFSEAHNDTAFTFLSNWYPATYYGYRLRAEVMNLRKTVNPIDNGDFESYPEVGNNWTLSHAALNTVVSATNVSGGNPGYCLDVELLNSRELGHRASYIDNTFEYISQLTPSSTIVSFDIRFSSDITQTNWLQVSVILLDELGNPKGLWVESTLNYHPTSWDHKTFLAFFINGTATLRVSIEKTDESNSRVDGHIFLDNFEYQIGSDAPPSEVGLTLNETSVDDTFGSNGEVDIYADALLKERIDPINAWNSTQVFCFNSMIEITFDFQYYLYVKSENDDSALTEFSVELNANPNWLINYTVPAGRPPPGYQGYQFGLFLEQGWVLSVVRNEIGNLITKYDYDATNQFFLLDAGIAAPGDTFTIYASGQNYVLEVNFQKSSTTSGPWTNVSTDDYFIIGDYVRVYALIEHSAIAGNTANISILSPNGTLCHSDTSPTLNITSNVLTSTAWKVEPVCEEFVGHPSTALVSYNSSLQCGFRSQSFSILNLARGTLIHPQNNAVLGWSGVEINVSMQNSMSESYITDARVVLRYADEFNQIQFAEMTPNGYGSYSIRISTQSYNPVTPITFDVEFYRRGYVNATFDTSTSLRFSVIVNAGLPQTVFGIDTRLLLLTLFILILFPAAFLFYRIYHKRVLVPRQIIHEKKLQEVLDMFNDVTNLSRVLVLHKNSGIPIFDPFRGRGIDASIFGGFLSAIQAFAIDVANGTDDRELKSNTHLSEISYEGFRIIINDGTSIRTALVYKGTPSQALKERTNQFTQRFEEQYHEEIVRYGNQPEKFSGAIDLLEELFHISLLFPHTVEPKTTDISLSVQESRLHFIALKIIKNSKFVFLGQIVNRYLETIQENPVELLNAVLRLREKKLLVPVDYPLHANSNTI